MVPRLYFNWTSHAVEVNRPIMVSSEPIKAVLVQNNQNNYRIGITQQING